MKCSTICDFAGRPGVQFGIVKTGTKNIRILEVGRPREESFVVPLQHVSNRRPAGCIPGPTPSAYPVMPEAVEFEDELAFLPQ